MRSEIISVRFELADLALARAAALALGLDFSTFLRMATMRAVTQLGPGYGRLEKRQASANKLTARNTGVLRFPNGRRNGHARRK